jgi:hypothetical protein
VKVKSSDEDGACRAPRACEAERECNLKKNTHFLGRGCGFKIVVTKKERAREYCKTSPKPTKHTAPQPSNTQGTLHHSFTRQTPPAHLYLPTMTTSTAEELKQVSFLTSCLFFLLHATRALCFEKNNNFCVSDLYLRARFPPPRTDLPRRTFPL